MAKLCSSLRGVLLEPELELDEIFLGIVLRFTSWPSTPRHWRFIPLRGGTPLGFLLLTFLYGCANDGAWATLYLVYFGNFSAGRLRLVPMNFLEGRKRNMDRTDASRYVVWYFAEAFQARHTTNGLEVFINAYWEARRLTGHFSQFPQIVMRGCFRTASRLFLCPLDSDSATCECPDHSNGAQGRQDSRNGNTCKVTRCCRKTQMNRV